MAETKKRSLFGGLLDSLTSEVPDEPAVQKPTPSAPPRSAPMGFSSAAPIGASTVSASPDPAALNKLQTLLQNAIPAVYGAFMDQYNALAEVIPDEGTRFKAALKTSKASADQIVGALDSLIETLNRALTDFQKSFEANRQTMVGQGEKSLKATDDLIASKEAQLKAIQDELVSLRGRRDTDAQQIHADDLHLQSVRAGFEAAHAQVLGQLNLQKSRISSMPRT